MTDNANNQEMDTTQIEEAAVETEQDTAPDSLIIKIGTTIITADANMVGMTTDELRESLKFQYPEVEHATVREATDAETGIRSIQWLARPGRKG